MNLIDELKNMLFAVGLGAFLAGALILGTDEQVRHDQQHNEAVNAYKERDKALAQAQGETP